VYAWFAATFGMDRAAVESAGCGWLTATALAWCRSDIMGGVVGVKLANRAAKRERWQVLMRYRGIWMQRNGY